MIYKVVVEVPGSLGEQQLDELFQVVGDSVYDWLPEDRDWDPFISGHLTTNYPVEGEEYV